MRLLKESDDASIYRVIRALEGTERQDTLLKLEKQQRLAAQDAALMRAVSKKKGFIRPAFTMAPKDFYQCMIKYGHEEVHSDEFARFHTKKHPEQRVTKY